MIAANLAGGKKAELDRQQRDLLQQTMDRVARALHKFIGDDYDDFPGGGEVKMEGDAQMTTHLVQAELPPVVAKSVADVAAVVEAQVPKVMSVTPV